ncbi:unnamed protein product [Amoebophrya sp. A25]|nr:unnamed protein product [Amoebophrya sp. A25]|eukprot:GSA25T00006498001.1
MASSIFHQIVRNTMVNDPSQQKQQVAQWNYLGKDPRDNAFEMFKITGTFGTDRVACVIASVALELRYKQVKLITVYLSKAAGEEEEGDGEKKRQIMLRPRK